MSARRSSEIIANWPGESDETTETELTWRDVGRWKRIVAQRAFWQYAFPAPHTDSVETFIDYRVPAAILTPLARFNGSVTVERTTGDVSTRRHKEQADIRPFTLRHDPVTGRWSPGARASNRQEQATPRPTETTGCCRTISSKVPSILAVSTTLPLHGGSSDHPRVGSFT